MPPASYCSVYQYIKLVLFFPAKLPRVDITPFQYDVLWNVETEDIVSVILDTCSVV